MAFETRTPKTPLKLAMLISGGGRTLANLHECIARDGIQAVIDVVVSSRGDAVGVERARLLGLPTMVVERKTLSQEQFDESLTEVAKGCDLICMAGFLSFWRIPDGLLGRVINVHPALLPDFGGPGMYGPRVHEAVLAAGRKESGCTIHYCDNEYDCGPVILQRRVPVLPDDTPATLAARVFEQECIAYPEAVRLFSEGRVKWSGEKVLISHE